MDFNSLSRRELQSLCMCNGIKANMTNLAMADALKSLQTVEGISETPRKAEPKTELQKAGRRAASSRQVGSARPHEPQGSPLPRSRRVTATFRSEEILNLAADAADTDEGKDKEWVPETPKAPTTRRRAQLKKEEFVESTIPKMTTTKRRATKKVEEEKTVGVTTRRRTRKTGKKEAEDLDLALKIADLGKDIVEEANTQSVEEGSGSTEEKEEKDTAQVLPIERSKEEGEEKGLAFIDFIENVLSNDSSADEETIMVEEKEDKEISFLEGEIDSKKAENQAEEEEQDDEGIDCSELLFLKITERGEFSSDETIGVTETVGNSNPHSEVGTSEILVEDTEKFDLLPLSVVSDNNKENHTGGDWRQKKIDPNTTMSLRKLKAHLKEGLINKKRSALKALEDNLLLPASMEDAVM